MRHEDVRVGNVNLDEVRMAPHNIRRDLGDLRQLADSIRRYGVMTPIVVERHATFWRLRAGHRRVAAARLAGLKKIPAVIHSDVLEVDEWIAASVQENVMRRGIDQTERLAAVAELRKLGCSTQGIAEVFGVSVTTVHQWEKPSSPEARRREYNHRRINRTRLRTLIDDVRARDRVSVEDVLAELEELLTPTPASDAAHDEATETAAAGGAATDTRSERPEAGAA